ncbi:substrate-binding domain-containing protein [uncultured Agrococcus sp.]|uniref:substrate-binding domain-containing protein n=1 Tax=uncultured Agrococcus sp. TaxID=382258 RepID=UPI0025EA0282|nr:substrate-binding domain-containing protein [uncultured Agrococcus sp.]
MRKRKLGFTALAATSALVLAGCSTVSNDGDGGGGDEAGPFTIGVSNGFVGSEYRTQMIEDIEEAATGYQDEGALNDLVLENADTDVNGQIQQVRNLINAGVDAIIVDPNSGSALDQVFREATDQGILVFAIDQAVTEETVINVGIDQALWAETSALWLADEVGEGGSIVAVNGASGHPANELRWEAAQGVFDDAGIEVLTTADGGWDQATGQQQMANLLATYPDIDGVWTQDGMALGVLQAVIAADREDDIIVSGEARNGFLRLWSEQDDDFESIGVVNPPGTGATALHIAMEMLQGGELDESQLHDGHNIVLELEEAITSDNFDDVWAEVQDQPDTYVLDSILSADDVQRFFQ